MQSKVLAAFVFACMTAFVSASPIPLSPPLDVEARTLPDPSEAESVAPVAREPSPEPEPMCRWNCY